MQTSICQHDRKDDGIKTDARTNNLRLDAQTHQRVMEAGGLLLVEKVNAAPAALLLRVLVRDISSGALGSLTVPLTRSTMPRP